MKAFTKKTITFCGIIIMLILCVSCGSDTASDSKNDGSDDTSGAGDEGLDAGTVSKNGTVLTEANNTKCDEICDKLRGCEPVEFAECNSECDGMAVALNQDAFDNMATCVDEQTCANVDPEQCIEDEMRNIPDSAIDDLIGTICDKMIECGQEGTKAECVGEQQNEGDMADFKMFNEKAQDCFGACLAEASCETLGVNAESEMEKCMPACDIDMGDGDNNGGNNNPYCGDMVGDWVVESLSCDGEPVDFSDNIVSQTITEDCHVDTVFTSGDCTISYDNDYVMNNDSLALKANSECGGGCTVDNCGTQSEEDVVFDISRSFDGAKLVVSYNTSSDVINSNMAPCSEGDLATLVFVKK